jgi:hypothetical protein
MVAVVVHPYPNLFPFSPVVAKEVNLYTADLAGITPSGRKKKGN